MHSITATLVWCIVFSLCKADNNVQDEMDQHVWEAIIENQETSIDGANIEESGLEAVGCDCDYHSGGCSISSKAPPGLACKCKYKGFWTCGGELTHCEDKNNRYCKHPDRSYASCKQGEGDCGGYHETSIDGANTEESDLEAEIGIDGAHIEESGLEAVGCDCDYHSGGCSISSKAPPGLACKCKYKGAWTCGGELTHCKDKNNRYCKHPDRSYASCKQGEGDCGGYHETSIDGANTEESDLEAEIGIDGAHIEESGLEAVGCDCDYHSGGCSISSAAPPGLACKCKYKGFWTCGGELTHCKNKNSRYCKHPDRSYASCKQGEGDCGGYHATSINGAWNDA